MTPQNVIALLADPEKLMRKCFLSIAGGVDTKRANGQAEICVFTVRVDLGPISAATGFTTGFSGLFNVTKARPTAWIVLSERYPAGNLPVLPADSFYAYYIPMVQIADVNGGTSHYTLPTAGFPGIVVTSQITGCVFSAGSNAVGTAMFSHVQPPPNTPNARALAANAGGTNILNMTQVQRQNTADRLAIIGVLSAAGRWRLFVQTTVFANGGQMVQSAAKAVTI